MALMNINKRFLYSGVVSDLLVLVFIVIIAVNYNYGTNLAPVSLFTVFQLGGLWYICRVCYYLIPVFLKYVIYAILLSGVIEAIWGLGQLYNFFPSNHFLFKTTGSFFNSGPYGGFIALIFPLTLHFWLVFRKRNRNLEYL